jgi:uncharacterized protein (TIGR03435 family)
MRYRNLSLGILVLRAMSAQTAPPQPEFEVEKIRFSQSLTESKLDVADGGSVTWHSVTMIELLAAAYSKREDELVNAPAWFRSDQFDIVAKGPPKMTESDFSVRMRSLLATEFKLAVHEEEQQRRAFALVVAKGGPGFQRAGSAGAPSCANGGTGGTLLVDCERTNIEFLIGRMRFSASDYVDRQVVDLTGLTGMYRLRLEWAPQRVVDAEGGLTLFDALTRQLGLKLEERRVPVKVIVVDRAEHPAIN